MGSGATKQQAPDRGASNQDAARSYRSKVGAIRLLIKNAESKAVFIQYMKDTPKFTPALEYLQCYFDVTEIINTLPSLVVQRTCELIDKHKRNSQQLGSETSQNILSSLGKLAKSNVATMEVPEIMTILYKSETEIFGHLTPAFDSFSLSDVYRKWKAAEAKQEKNALEKRRTSVTAQDTRHPSVKDYFKSILIVDDSTVTAKIASLALIKDGHEVEIAKDGGSAFELLKTKHYDLLLVELTVPQINGYELTKMYRKIESIRSTQLNPTEFSAATPKSPMMTSPKSKSAKKTFESPSKKTEKKENLVVVGMSIEEESVVKNRMDDAGISLYVQKPFQLSNFLAVVNKHIQDTGMTIKTKPVEIAQNNNNQEETPVIVLSQQTRNSSSKKDARPSSTSSKASSKQTNGNVQITVNSNSDNQKIQTRLSAEDMTKLNEEVIANNPILDKNGNTIELIDMLRATALPKEEKVELIDILRATALPKEEKMDLKQALRSTKNSEVSSGKSGRVGVSGKF